MKHARWYGAAALIVAGVVAPAAICTVLELAPRTVLRVANIGTFLSARASSGGLLSPSLTTVKSSAGTVVVYQQYSAPRGMQLKVVDGLVHGLELCSTDRPVTCAEVAGGYAGTLHPVAHVRRPFVALLARIGIHTAFLWLLMGMPVSLFGALLLFSSRERKPVPDRSDTPSW